MENYNINNLDVRYKEDNYLYQVKINNDKYSFRRVIDKDEYKICDSINYNNKNITVKKIVISKKNISELSISNSQKSNIINELFESIENNNILYGFINFSNIKEKIKKSIVNILIANENIGLSAKNIKCIKSDIFTIDIVNINNYDIIGSLVLQNDNIFVNVDEIYKEDVIKLYENLKSMINPKKLCKKNIK